MNVDMTEPPRPIGSADTMIDPETGSVDLRAELANQDGTLVPGQFIRVRLLVIQSPGAILVPLAWWRNRATDPRTIQLGLRLSF